MATRYPHYVTENNMDGQDESRFLAPQSSDQIQKSIPELEGLITTFAASFSSHPGFMLTDVGFEVLHADWPAYPIGHGLRPALQTLAEFPFGTRFWELDQIDQCCLFIVGHKPDDNAFASHFFHVAVWNDDLRDCGRRGYVAGIQDEGTHFYFPDGAMTLTGRGAQAALIHELTRDVAADLLAKIESHLFSEQYDTAVREVTICVELAMRCATNSSLHGMHLVDHCFGKQGVLVPSSLPNNLRLGLRTMFRTYFSYVRNEYAHEFPPTDAVTACRIVRRSGDLIRVLEVLKSKIKAV